MLCGCEPGVPLSLLSPPRAEESETCSTPCGQNGTIDNIKALEDQGIRAYVPLPNWEERYEVWSASHFCYEPQADQYRCPQGQILQRVGWSAPTDVSSIVLLLPYAMAARSKGSVREVNQGRRLYRHVGEEYLERVRSYQQTLAYQKALRKRRVWTEPLFAEAKEWHGMRRFRLRRLWRVNCEAQIIAAGHNLQQLLRKRGWGQRPFPADAICASFWLFWVIYLTFLEEEFSSFIDRFSFFKQDEARDAFC